MVDKRNRFLFLMFLLVTVCVHTNEFFKVCREIFGIENVMPLGNNEDNVEIKTPLPMEETNDYNNTAFEEMQTNDYNNAALNEVQTTEDKNPSINLLKKI